jgi:hypothetical protein
MSAAAAASCSSSSVPIASTPSTRRVRSVSSTSPRSCELQQEGQWNAGRARVSFVPVSSTRYLVIGSVACRGSGSAVEDSRQRRRGDRAAARATSPEGDEPVPPLGRSFEPRRLQSAAAARAWRARCSHPIPACVGGQHRCPRRASPRSRSGDAPAAAPLASKRQRGERSSGLSGGCPLSSIAAVVGTDVPAAALWRSAPLAASMDRPSGGRGAGR